jgi:hypothetical protein
MCFLKKMIFEKLKNNFSVLNYLEYYFFHADKNYRVSKNSVGQQSMSI